MAIHFHFDVGKHLLKQKKALKTFLQDQILTEGTAYKSVHLQYIFVDDEQLLHINQQFLNHDYYTDIITFDLSEDELTLEGEIYISIDRVKDNAQTFKASVEQELHRVIFHGALHLLGYLDKSDADAQLMRQKENEWLTKYGFQL